MSGGDLLGRFGISGDAEIVWLALIEAGEASIDDLVVLTSQDRGSVASAIELLVAEAFVSRDGATGRIRPFEPTLAVEAQLAREERRLAEQLEDLRKVRTQLPDLSRRHASGQVSRAVSASIDVIVDTIEIRRLLALAAEQTKTICRSMMRRGTAAGMRETYGPTAEMAARGIKQHTLVSTAYLADEERYAEALRLQEAGDRQRTLPTLPTHMLIYDDELVVLPLSPGQLPMGAMFIREIGAIEPLTALFDQLWSVALPVFAPPNSEQELSQRGTQILALIAGGATDTLISRSLGVGTRTVRRDVAALRDTLGVGSRMEIVPAAVRRGWL
jgi:DNA-binding CsgD family transcriptional regulator